MNCSNYWKYEHPKRTHLPNPEKYSFIRLGYEGVDLSFFLIEKSFFLIVEQLHTEFISKLKLSNVVQSK